MKAHLLKLLLWLPVMLLTATTALAQVPDLSWTEDVGARITPAGTTTYYTDDYGAVGDGETLNSEAIQRAVDECYRQGGGAVTFRGGRYLTGSVYLKEGVHFMIPKNTTLLGSTDIADYPEIDTRVAGLEMRWPSALINVLDGKNVMISGEGTIHAQGKVFWDYYWDLRRDYEARGLRWIVDYDAKRPRTILIQDSEDVTLKDLTIKQAGFWTVQVLYSSYCTVDGLVIRNNEGGHGPSTDGVDIDSSSRILVENCDIDCNDDNFCLKAGRDADGLRVNRPTEYIVIRNCISRAGGGLLTCGSETSGGIRYVLADGLKAEGTNVVIRLKSAMNRGGTTEHIYVRNVEARNVGTIFEASMNWNPSYSYSTLPPEYAGKAVPEHWTKMLEAVSPEEGTPYFRNVYLNDFHVEGARTFMNVAGSEVSRMEYFSFENMDAWVEKLGRVTYARDWQFSGMHIRAADGQPLAVTNSTGVGFPLNPAFGETDFSFDFPGKQLGNVVQAAGYPEFAFLFPEMAGNLKFGIGHEGQSKWLKELQTIEVGASNKYVKYTISDPLLKRGTITVEAAGLSDSDGIVLKVTGKNLPDGILLYWAYGGASGEMLSEGVTGSLKPSYCRDNVFSVEWTAFTLYYGESMRLRTVQAVAPVTSEIRLSDAYVQATPEAFFESGKATSAPALCARLPLGNGKPEYFCVYRQNEKADYNHFMLPALFERESNRPIR